MGVERPGLTLWRGMSSSAYVAHVILDRSDTVVDAAYMSCSLQRSVANFYARRHAMFAEDLEDALVLKIEVPPGVHVLCAACDSSAGVSGEEEVLLPRGSVLRIDRVVPRDSTTTASVHYAEARLVVGDNDEQEDFASENATPVSG